MGPNEVDVKDLSSLPNASEKDSAAPAIQKYANPPKAQVGLLVTLAAGKHSLVHEYVCSVLQ